MSFSISSKCHGMFRIVHHALLASLIVLVCVGTGYGQLTAKAILADAVTTEGADVAPTFNDVKDAIEHLRSGKLADAKESLEAASKKNPQLAPANVLLAKMLLTMLRGCAQPA